MLNPKDFEKRVADARKAGKRSEIVDGDGLYLDVTATGAATWRYRYRVNGRREKISIGLLSDIGLAAARKQRAIIAGRAATAENTKEALSPAQERQQEKLAARVAKQAGTIKVLSTQYLAHLRSRGRKANSVDWHINAYIIPELGSTKTPELTQEQIKRLCNKIKIKAPASARSVLATIKQMMKFAKSEGLVNMNPAADLNPISLAPKVSRERSLSSDELRAFLVGCDNSGMSAVVSAALKLILLTLCRKSEIAKAPWTEIDLDAGMWVIPGDRTKNGKAHMIPLPPQAIAILNTIKPDRTDDDPIVPYSPWVFPGRFGEAICDSTLNEAIRAAKWFGLERFTIHDLRRTASTILHEQGWNTDVIEKALNHTMQGIRGIYNRAEYLDQRREMLQAWADYLDALKTGAKVVPIGKGKAA
jgi:integrase